MPHADADPSTEPAAPGLISEPAPEATLEPLPAPPPPKGHGPLAVLGGLLLKPRRTFAYLRDHGGASWLWPVLLALALTLTARLVAVPIERAQAQAALEAMQAQLEEQLPPGGGEDTFTFGAGVPVGGMGFSVGPAGTGGSRPLLDYGMPLLAVLGQWLLAAVALLAGAWLLGGRPSPGAMLRMSAWAWLVPVAVRSAVALALMLTTGRLAVSGLTPLPSGPVITNVEGGEALPVADGGGQVVTVGPGGAVGRGGGVGNMYLTFLRSNFLSSLDIYTVWGLLLLVAGVAVTARLGWLKSTVATAGYWGLSLALAALPPVLSFWVMTLSGAGGMMPLR